MATEAEKLERARAGPHKEPVDVYFIDEKGKQVQPTVSPDGKILARSELLLQSEYDRTITRDANGRITQIVITDGVRTKTMDITRDANGRITAIDETVV